MLRRGGHGRLASVPLWAWVAAGSSVLLLGMIVLAVLAMLYSGRGTPL